MINLYCSFEVFSRCITQINSSHCRVVVAQSVGSQAVNQVAGSSNIIDNYGEYIRGTRSINANKAPQ